MKIKLEAEHFVSGETETLARVEMSSLPALGELLRTGGHSYEVIQVVHTPLGEEEAIVVLKRRL